MEGSVILKLFVWAFLLNGICSAGNSGKEFVTVMMQNYMLNYGTPRFELLITTYSSSTKVSVTVNKSTFKKDYSVSTPQTFSVELPATVELSGTAKLCSTILIKADKDISVVSLNYKKLSADISIIYPVQSWGTEYYVVTPLKGPSDSFKEIAIINSNFQENSVEVYLTAPVNMQDKIYPAGSRLIISLDALEVLQLQSDSDLTGTRVVSKKPVGVMSGHTCTWYYSKCNHAYEQLCPVTSWGKSFIVPKVPFQSTSNLVYIIAYQKLRVQIQSLSKSDSKDLNSGDVYQILAPDALYITSNGPIQVMFYCTGGRVGFQSYDPFLMNIPAIDDYCTKYTINGQNEFNNYAVIVAKTSATSTLTFNQKAQSTITWTQVPGSDYSYGAISYGTGSSSNSMENPKSAFGLFSVGYLDMNGYGAPAVCASEGVPVDPCKDVQCRKKEKCQVIGGEAVCIPDSEVTCWAWGDPHYKTFDGQTYDFQGTCTYTIAKTCGNDSSLPSFNIEAKNENRGNTRVSFVSIVNVQIYGFNITAVKAEYGKVRINNNLERLPITLQDGKIKVYQSGLSVIIEGYNKLKVSYDWNYYLLITLPSSYYENVCGMCGNYNGNSKDDFMTQSMTLATNAIDFGKSWKVNDGDRFCWDNCNGECKTCDANLIQKYKSDQYCGLLSNKVTGPFRNCHAVIDPQIYLDNCVYDVCMHDGYKVILCQALKTYADACQANGVTLYEWRNTAGCPLSCPANSKYNLCGTSCPPTCDDDTAPSKCNTPCVETCQCNDGFVLIDGKCMPKSNCGCTYRGRPYAPGEKFWGDDNCKQSCVCNPLTRTVECKATNCKSTETCSVVDGIRDCYPMTYGTCSASGDPHYVTFDGVKYDFQGTCVYQFVSLCVKDDSLVNFTVNVQNNYRGSKVVSYTKLVQTQIYGIDIVMSTDNPDKIVVNDILTNLPYSLESNNLKVYKSGYDAILQTGSGIRVTFNWQSRVSVTIPSTYSGAVCGLCGNFNKNTKDDLTMKNGKLAANAGEFGQSWKTDEIPGCSHGCKGNCPDCAINEKKQYEKDSSCGLILKKDGPFRECHSKIDPNGYFQDCLYDVCLYKGRESILCQAITAYVAACQDAGVKIYPWRSDTFCNPSCGKNSHYEVCSSGCPTTCSSLVQTTTCNTPCKEGCQCNDGFIVSGDTCVPISECGCQYNGKYYKSGETFYPNNLCQEVCKCNSNAQVECSKFSCSANEECKVVDGVQKCQPIGSGTCSASGDPHYISFDGHTFDFQGTCRYILAKSSSDDKNLVAFSVEVENESWGNGKVAVTKMLSLKVYGQTFTLLQKRHGQIKVNDISYNLPLNFNNTLVIAQQHGNHIMIKADFGLKMSYDLVYYATVTIPGNYKNKISGLCGNYNGDKKDDFMLPNSKTTKDVVEFGASWKVNVPGAKCDDGCSGNNCPTCDATKTAIFQKENYCGILTAPEGPLSACYTAVDPQVYFNNCVYDLCASNGDTKVLCNSIQSYVAACQEAKITIKEWRTDSFCPLSCMANSHYKLCADICSSACAGITDPLKCPTHCVEGCECDDGYFFDGQECITIDNCGCYENGRYYKNNEVVLSANCKEKCFCSPAGGLMCEPTDCQIDEKCDIVDGTVMCRSKDPCKKFNCREKEKCKLINDLPVCVPDFTVSCWAWGDPHYHTFDGYNYDFQGTCTYTIAKTCGNDTTLPPFEIVEKNDNRGNTAVSYVRLVNIYAYGHKITIVKLEIGKVRVNDVITNLPVTLEDGKLRLTQSGGNAVLETEFGLRVTYDWNWYLYITIPSSYYKSVCGLCGNFNGNLNDERMTSDGTLAPTVIDWAKSWKVKDRDKFCFDVCQGVCPTCDDAKRALYESETYCGLLTKKIDGAFKECHAKVNPDDFFDNCVYDVCLNNGAKQLLCQALNSYATTCRKNGVIIYDWRKQAGCPMDCGPNSHYEACGNACPASCSDRKAPSTCTDPCVETCTCDSGYVLSAGKCVATESCGCTYQGRYYNPNEEFWQDDNCRIRCRCDPKLGMVVCVDNECKSNEKCDIVNGVQNCYPISYSTCSASGDPHYITFDNLRFDFQGTCIYLFIGVSSKDPTLTPFEVKVQNDNRGNKVVSFSKTVFINVYNTTITISKEYPYQILVNGILTALPYYVDTNKVRVYRSGVFAMVETDFGLAVKFDCNSALSATLPSTYARSVKGLCGNYNQNSKDDFTMPDGVLATTAVKFGDSWKVGNVPGCAPECTGTCPVCNEAQKQKYRTDKFCGIIISKTGPFRDCLAVVDPTPYFENCVYDACQYNGHPSSYCDAITTYVAACQTAGLPVYQWRTDSFCRYNCPRNSHYELCGPGCPATCSGLSAPEGCLASCREGCQCDNGYILSGDKCAPIASCGCTYNGQYYQKGAEFYPNGLCKEKCTCSKDGVVTCKKSACGANEECRVVNGVQGCYPIGYGKCVASGDPHYISFDGLTFDFQGTCTYILAKYTGSDKTLTPFAVLVENESYGSGNVAVTRMVVLDLLGKKVTMTQGMKWKVKVNEEMFNLPVSLADGNLWVNQEGNNIVAQTRFGLQVLYDSVYYVSVTVPSNYKKQMGGLCGNFNDDRTDDFILPDGNKTKDVNTFGGSWKVKIRGAKCNDGCTNNCPSCDQTKTALYSKENKCGIISSTKGPFSSCLLVVDPTIYLNNCIYDLCAADGKQDTLCKSLQAYAAACQSAGVVLKDWRTTSGCPLTCPANSHYELCTRTCDQSCAGITDSLGCTDNCFEGCECNAGFVSRGEECVSMDNCGCFYEGRYYKPDETVVYPDCSQSCTCYATGGVICKDTSCTEDQFCLVKNGVRGCFQKDGTCSLKKGGQLLSFDEMSGKLSSNGVYEIASICDDDSPIWFRVVADIQPCNKEKVLLATTVFVFFDDVFIAMNRDKQIWVNGRPVQIPAKAGKDISLTSLENMTVIKYSSNIKVSISTTGEIIVVVGDDFANRLCGACGNFNDDKSDDMKLPDGKITVSINDFLNAWKAKDFSYCDS
ncbi:IgGFc-binding protein-like [Protopterus annectens]|uniref:IgGFc-binding protein-like n=1 Tax=Protopterus annectens TaxID=7888 RepID=UPI001CFB6DA4|nr:IgGFc-binding protein-like [Protopterus annectens]